MNNMVALLLLLLSKKGKSYFFLQGRRENDELRRVLIAPLCLNFYILKSHILFKLING